MESRTVYGKSESLWKIRQFVEVQTVYGKKRQFMERTDILWKLKSIMPQTGQYINYSYPSIHLCQSVILVYEESCPLYWREGVFILI